MKSPLRYPGSKLSFAPLFFKLLKDAGYKAKEIVEPFAGSAAVSLYGLEHDFVERAVLVERDPLVAAFWRSVFERTDELVEVVQSTEITLDKWLELEALRSVDTIDESQLITLGFAGLFFNRANFSGIIGASPIGGISQSSEYKINCRFNKSEVARTIRSIARHRDRIKVRMGDALQTIDELSSACHADRLLFVDPPYFEQGRKLYRYHYGIADHLALSKALGNTESPFFLTYDKNHIIEMLYQNQYIIDFRSRYSTRVPKLGNELLISNRPMGQILSGKAS